MKPWITVGEALSPDGTRLELVEHDGEYIIKADDLPLMSTRMHFSEVELCVPCQSPWAQDGNIHSLPSYLYALGWSRHL